MNQPIGIGLYIAGIGLALAFLIHGLAMLSLPETLQDRMAYMWDIPQRFRRFIGVSEVLAAAGLTLPTLTGILPWLTPLAALGLIIIMIGAIVFHIRRGEYRSIILNVLLLVVSAFVFIWLWLPAPVR